MAIVNTQTIGTPNNLEPFIHAVHRRRGSKESTIRWAAKPIGRSETLLSRRYRLREMRYSNAVTAESPFMNIAA